MPRAQLINTIIGEILEDLGFYESDTCAEHAGQILIWKRSPDDFWIA